MDHRWNEAMATRRPVIREPSISPIPATSIMRYEPKDFSYVACVLARSTFCSQSNSATLWKMENQFRSFVCENAWISTSLKHSFFVKSSLREIVWILI